LSVVTADAKNERTLITKVTPLDPVNTPPYGVFKHVYMAVTADTTPVLHSPEAGAAAWVTLQAGAKISILEINDGWAKVPYWRDYGYVDTRLLKELTPVSPTDSPVSGETPIAAFTSFYNVATTEANKGRMKNIDVACKRLSRVYQPGEELDFNKQIGPWSKANGYFPAPVLIDGGSQLGYGGGTCQVSSTFYNTVLQLPGVTVLYRRPHGPAGAKYLPHGVDAAVGNSSLNLRIRNDYEFPIRVVASAQDGALFMCIYKQ
jgi:vancomycin resistance protein YoaR